MKKVLFLISLFTFSAAMAAPRFIQLAERSFAKRNFTLSAGNSISRNLVVVSGKNLNSCHVAMSFSEENKMYFVSYTIDGLTSTQAIKVMESQIAELSDLGIVSHFRLIDSNIHARVNIQDDREVELLFQVIDKLNFHLGRK